MAPPTIPGRQARREYPRLSRAPITEALIDIQAALPVSATMADLEALHVEVRDGYPVAKKRYRSGAQFELKEGEAPGLKVADSELTGFGFWSADEKQVVQFRIDGFTFSRLKPYENWDGLRDEARRLWGIYSAATGPEAIRRVAVRYINLMELPTGERLEEYITSLPQPPPGLLAGRTSFMQRVAFDLFESGASAIVTQMTEVAKSAVQAPFWLDIEVSRATDGPLSDSEIWDLLEMLRRAKNDLFFAAVTDKALGSLK